MSNQLPEGLRFREVLILTNPFIMKRFKKIAIAVVMMIVWLVMFVMVIPMKSSRGQVATVLICLLINSALGIYYSLIDNRPTTFREWLKH
ncbi:hypothetical protein GCM10028805_42240 [Spirosoma harenae]